MAERNIENYPVKYLQWTDPATGQEKTLVATAWFVWKLPMTISICLGVWGSVQEFELDDPMLPDWKFVCDLTNEEQTLYAALIESIKDGALNWMNVTDETHQLVAFSINVAEPVATAACHVIGDANFGTHRNSTPEQFQALKISNQELAIAFDTLIWTVAKDKDERYRDFE